MEKCPTCHSLLMGGWAHIRLDNSKTDEELFGECFINYCPTCEEVKESSFSEGY